MKLNYKKSFILGISSQIIGCLLAILISRYFDLVLFNYFGIYEVSLLIYAIPGVVIAVFISLFYRLKYPSEEIKKILSIVGFSSLSAFIGFILFFLFFFCSL
jgi:ABC-type Fe3+ transport system permease subunit